MAQVTKAEIGLLNALTELILEEPGAIDQKFEEEPIAEALLKNIVQRSGVGIKQHVIIDRGNTFGYASGGEYTLHQTDPTALMQFTWKHFAADMVIPKTTADFSENKEAFGNLLKIQRDVAFSSLLHDVANMFRGVAVPNIPIPLVSFADIANTSGTIGGLSRTTYPILNGVRIAMNAAPYTITTIAQLIFNNNLVSIIQQGIRKCSRAGKREHTTVVFLPDVMWDVLTYIANQVFSPVKSADARQWGGAGYTIDNTLCVNDPDLPDALGYIIVANFDYLDLVTHPKYSFTFSGWESDPKSDNLIGLIKLSGELVCLKPKRQCLITNCLTTFTMPTS